MDIAVIGLGAMGEGMATNLHRAGMLRYAWNRTPERAQQLASDKGFALAGSLADIAKECDAIITCVSADEDVIEVIDTLYKDLKPGSIIIDTSTIRVVTARQLSEKLLKKNCYFLDAPVSGGVEGAQNGELVFMVGGNPQALEKVMPLLEVLGKKTMWMGESGNGQATKAVNQIMAAGINQAVSEALAFAEGMQLPMGKVIDVISGGAAGNWFLQKRGPTMTEGQFEAGFRVALHKKDLDICRDMVESICELDMRLPVVEMTRVHYDRLIEQGFGDEDISSLFRLKREMFRKDQAG